MAQSFHGGNKIMGLEKLNELDYSYIQIFSGGKIGMAKF